MSLTLLGAEVYDPALSGAITQPVRLEIMVKDLPVKPTHVEELAHFTVSHYHWLQTIEAPGYLGEEWDDENTELCAATYNTSMYTADREAIVPVTVAYKAVDDEGQDIWQDFYIKISRMQRILNRLELERGSALGYECIPNPTFVSDKEFGWMLMHPARVCARCSEELSYEVNDGDILPLADLPSGCQLIQVSSHKLVPMCSLHRAQWNEAHRIKRESQMV